MKSCLCLMLGVIVASVSLPLAAHHSVSAEFDPDSPISFTGVVTSVDWMNPHIYTHVEVQTEDGPVTYRVEGSAPNSLYRRGWRSTSARIGETLTVVGVRARNPESMNVGQATLTNSEGVELYVGQAPR